MTESNEPREGVTHEDIRWLERQMYFANQRGQHEPQERITRILLTLSRTAPSVPTLRDAL